MLGRLPTNVTTDSNPIVKKSETSKVEAGNEVPDDRHIEELEDRKKKKKSYVPKPLKK